MHSATLAAVRSLGAGVILIFVRQSRNYYIDRQKVHGLTSSAGLCVHSLWGLLHITHPQDQALGHSSQVWRLPTEHSWHLVG